MSNRIRDKTLFHNERGSSKGSGFNRNIPLPEQVDGAHYRRALARVISQIVQMIGAMNLPTSPSLHCGIGN